MKGYRIFAHSVRMVFGNLPDVLRLTAVLYAVVFVGFFGFDVFGATVDTADVGPTEFEGAEAGRIGLFVIGMVIAAAICQLWIIVGWHRFVLLEEYPRSWIPRWPGRAVWRYLGRFILLGLLIGLLLVPVFLLVGGILVAVPPVGFLLFSGFTFFLSWLFFRLGLVLPAAAVGEKLTFREAWTATKSGDTAIVLVAVIMVAFSAILRVPGLAMDAVGASLLATVFAAAANWINMLVGASILTTLFGNYVQGRAID